MIFSPNLTKLIQQLLLPRILHEAPAARLRAHPVPGRKRSPEEMCIRDRAKIGISAGDVYFFEF